MLVTSSNYVVKCPLEDQRTLYIFMGIVHSSVLCVGTLEWTIPMSIYIYTCNYRSKFDIGDVAFVCAMFHVPGILVHVAHLPTGHTLLHLRHLTMGASRTKHVPSGELT